MNKYNDKLAEYLKTDKVDLCEELIIIKTALAVKSINIKKLDKLTRKRVYSLLDNATKRGHVNANK